MSKSSEALLEKLKQEKEEVEAIQALWRSLFRSFVAPDYLQCHVWLDRHKDFDTVVYGLKATAVCLNKKATALDELEESTEEQAEATLWARADIIKYASACMIQHQERKHQ
jgi:hypothetical protein